MPWDCFCPKCSAVCISSITDDPKEMEKEMEEYTETTVTCACGCVFDFDTGREYQI